MSEMTPRAILEKHTWEGSLWIADDLRPAQAVAKDLYAALAQEIADHEADRAHIEALEKAAKAYLNWHRRQKLEPESPADFLNDELEEDRLGDELCAALAAEEKRP